MSQCLHLGERIRWQECQTCKKGGMRVWLEVRGCALHGECTPKAHLPDLICCKSCANYQPAGTAVSLPELSPA